MIAYDTLVMVHKVVNTRQPSYLAERLQIRMRPVDRRKLRGQGERMIVECDQSLSVSRGGFVYRGGRLFNMLSENLRAETSTKKFKAGVRTWVKQNIEIKPGI